MDRQAPDKARTSSFDLVEVTPLQWARALRRATELGFSDEKLAVLERYLTGEQEPEPTRIVETIAPTQLAHPRLKTLEMKIRQLAEGDADWLQLEPLVWQLYQLQPGPYAAAKVVELTFLYGDTEQLQLVYERISELEDAFYPLIQSDIRGYLVMRFWLERIPGLLTKPIQKLEFRKLPIERLLEFSLLEAGEDQAQAFIYFQQHEQDLQFAISEFGEQLGISLGDFHLRVGKLAVRLEYDVMARKILAKISKDDSQYLDALQLLLELKVERDGEGLCYFGRKLERETDWRSRVKMFYDFLNEARRLDGMRHKGRAALNDLLRDPLKWVPSIPEAWSAMSRMLVANADLDVILPNIAEVFKDAVVQFQPAALDLALWHPCLSMATGDKARDYYWRGMAHFHLFMTGQESFEDSIWDATECYQYAEENTSRPLPVNWRHLHKVAAAWITKTPILTEKRRVAMQRQLRLASDPQDLTSNDILNYLDQNHLPPYRVMQKLVRLAKAKNDDGLMVTLLQRKAQLGHYTNEDLQQLWDLCGKLNKHDLAWRVATVLHARQSLTEKVLHPWGISGENRNEYSLAEIPFEIVAMTIKELKADEQKFLTALLKVGPLVPDLLALLDTEVRVIKAVAPKPGTREQLVEKALDQLSWLGDAKRQYRFSHEKHLLGRYQIPAFVQILPSNTWSLLVIRLAARLGCASWGWSLSWLHQQLETLMPRLVQGAENKVSAKVGRWLKGLGPEERKAWYDLIGAAGKIRDEQGVELMALLIMRIALVMNQNHYQALTSLHTMRAPLVMVRHLENWILSPEYSQIRRKMQSNNKVPVPLALHKGESILKPV